MIQLFEHNERLFQDRKARCIRQKLFVNNKKINKQKINQKKSETMVTNQNQANSGQGGQGRSNQKQSQPKVVIRAYADVNITGNTYVLLVETSAFQSGQPMANQDVFLKERTSTLDTQKLDLSGEALLRSSGSLMNSEQIKTLRICLTGVAEEKTLNVTIPAIPKVVLKPKTISVIPGVIAADLSTGTYSLSFLVNVLEENLPMKNQRVALREGISQLAEIKTDNNGNATFNVAGNLGKTEKEVTYRFFLTGFGDNVEQNVTLPATESKKQDSDPESLILRRYHDGRGNFRIKIRVINSNGVGLAMPVNIWYRGNSSSLTTDAQGDAFFDVPDYISPGKEYELIASVSGIAQDAKIDIKRGNTLKKVKMFSERWWATNNARALIALVFTSIFWIIFLFSAGNGQPVISPDLFRNENGLSSAEQHYNNAASIVGEAYTIPASTSHQLGWFHAGPIFWLGLLSIWTVLVLAYSIFSLREEIRAGLEEGFEKLFDKDYAKAGDPAFEKLAKLVGSYHVARSPKIIVEGENSGQNSGNNSEGNNTNSNDSGHPSLGTLFRMDLLSDALVTLVPLILKKIF